MAAPKHLRSITRVPLAYIVLRALLQVLCWFELDEIEFKLLLLLAIVLVSFGICIHHIWHYLV